MRGADATQSLRGEKARVGLESYEATKNFNALVKKLVEDEVLLESGTQVESSCVRELWMSNLAAPANLGLRCQESKSLLDLGKELKPCIDPALLS